MSMCPVCCRKLTQLHVNMDAVMCPVHGTMPGLLAYLGLHLEPWEALVEIRAHQLRSFVAAKFWFIRHELRLYD